MTTYNTGNPLGSAAAKDLFDNAQNLDFAVNSITQLIWLDRFGKNRKTWFGIEKTALEAIAAFGYITIDSFEDGANITLPNQVLRWESNGEYYRWGGDFPKLVPADSTPETAGGIGSGKWLSIGDAQVRQELNIFKDAVSSTNDGEGDALLAVKQPFTGAVPETQHDHNAKRIDAISAGAVGDGVTDDSAAFTALEAQSQYGTIDGLGKTYVVSTYPSLKKYINATFIVDGKTLRSNWFFNGATRNSNVLVGDGAGKSLPSNPTTSLGTNNIAVGEDALPSGTEVRSSIAFGTRAMFSAITGKYNMAFGLESLYYVDGDGSDFGGTRNVMFGDNTGRFITTGYQNIGIGRNAAQGITTGNNNLAMGTNSMAGKGSLKFRDSQYIQNQTPITVERCTAVGSNSLYYGGGSGSSALGERALTNAKPDSTNCTAYGASALLSLGSLTSQIGKISVIDGRIGTYSMTSSGVTFNLNGHGLTTGWQVIVSLTSGVDYADQQYYTITVNDANSFTVNEPYGITASGAFTLVSYSTLATQTVSPSNTALGAGAMYNVQYGSENLAVGVNAMPLNTGGNQNTSIGNLTMSYAVSSSQNTAVGYLSLRLLQDGTQATSLSNSTGIGYNARVSGNNQVQLGNAATTTYVYGTVQNRSDIRDKADVEDTTLGIDFINGLRPVDGRWNMRDDYYEDYEEQVGLDSENNPLFETKTRFLESDYKLETKKRTRLHHWFIAQEVNDLCTKMGVEFGGIQHQEMNGGSDIFTLGYDEFIPPAVRAIQQCWTRLDELEKRILSLEQK